MKSYLSAKQVVQKLNGAISVKLIYRLVEQGKLRANRSLGKVLIEEDSLIELLEDNVRSPPPEKHPPRKSTAKRPIVDLW
jgi:hypothetical protein